MVVSSGVDPSELYDGPIPADNIVQAGHRFEFTPAASENDTPARHRRDYVATISAALDVLGARLLGLIATVAGCLIWGWAVYEPELLRTYAAAGYSITVLLPIIVVYWKRG
jgi:hypothetical protein